MVKVADTRLPSVGFRFWSRFLAVSLQVMSVINPAVGCHYFRPGLQLPLQPLRGLLPISLLVNRGTIGVNSLPKTVTRRRHGCDMNPGPSASESSTLTTELTTEYSSRFISGICARCLTIMCIIKSSSSFIRIKIKTHRTQTLHYKQH